MHRGICKQCGAAFWESSKGARGEDLCDNCEGSPPSKIRAVRTINLQPTWEAMTRLYIALLEDGDAEGRETARSELFRMARIADTYVKEHAPKEPDES